MDMIKALECCIQHNPDDRPRCGDCPLLHAEQCVNRLKFTALDLIREQEEIIRSREAELKRETDENIRLMKESKAMAEELRQSAEDNIRILKQNKEMAEDRLRKADSDALIASAEKDLAKADTTIQQSMVETLSRRAMAKAILAIAKEFME